jgi:integrase
MGRRSKMGGVIAKGNRIRLDFWFQDTRYRPTLDIEPSQANLKRAQRRLIEIRQKIDRGTFQFSEEFPQYRFLANVAAPTHRPTFNKIADLFVASIGDLEYATRESYRKILDSFWRPKLGERPIEEITYAELAAIVGGHPWGSTKTRNNIVSVGRRVFDFAYADLGDRRNPAERLKSLKVQRQPPDPYTVDEAEKIIGGMHKDWGEHDANYVEFGFFTGARPSELIALRWSDVTLSGSVRISRARVMAQDKSKTKTAVVRDIELCPRAQGVIKKQRALTGLLKHEHVFARSNSEPFNDLQLQWKRWVFTHKRLGIRYREPYQMRHTSVTWNLMIGENLLKVAQQHGHSAAVMLKVYARWIAGSTDKDVNAIRRAMGFGTRVALAKSGK